MAKVSIGIKDIRTYIGRELGLSEWVEVTQGRVNKFADATDDFQWTHVDPVRARNELSSGRTIAHNFLLLSMIPRLFDQVVAFTGLSYGLNRGAENIYFLQSVPAGSKVRIRVKLLKLEYLDQRGMTATFHIVMEMEACDKAVLAADLQLLFVV